MSEIEEEDSQLSLEYGYIILIIATQNEDLHEKTFFIDYIDDSKIKLINVASLKPYRLSLDDNGNITDESIQEIQILSRAEEPGYARQNGLNPKTWVDIHFGGEFPVIVTGEITDLDEDQIEITTYPDLDVLYIDFEYKGLPENIPIEHFIIRKKPASVKVSSLTNLKGDDSVGFVNLEDDDRLASIESLDSGESITHIPENVKYDDDIRELLHDMYIDANDIVFSDETEYLDQVVEVKETERRYTLELQINDLMDELLSTIPNHKRTKGVLENIHRIIERFKELRKDFTIFDENGGARGYTMLGANHKPLVERIRNLDTNLKWLIPVVASRKKIFNIEKTDEDDETADIFPDIVNVDMSTELKEQASIQDAYDKNTRFGDVSKYQHVIQQSSDLMTPFDVPLDMRQVMNSKNMEIATNIEGIIESFENLSSTAYKNSVLTKQRFVIQKYNLGETMIKPEIMKGGKTVYLKKLVTKNDKIPIKSFIMMPYPLVNYSKINLPSCDIMTRSSLSQNPFYLFQALTKTTIVDQEVISKFNEFDYEKWEEQTKQKFMSTIREFVIDDSIVYDDYTFRRYLDTIIPKTRILIKLFEKYIHDKLSFYSIVKMLEPFQIYSSDISYPQYNEIRFFIKEQIKEHKKEFAKKADEYAILKNYRYNMKTQYNEITEIVFDNQDLHTTFKDGYDIIPFDKSIYISAQELLANVFTKDNCKLLSTIIKYLNINLIIPEGFLDQDDESPEDYDLDLEKIKPADCNRRFMTKKYTTLSELQKDNGEEIFYDPEFDDTPYSILNKYKKEKKETHPKDFADFFAEILVQKHGCPRNQSAELAATIIAGMKRINDGEYAVLEIRPTGSETPDSQAESEANIRKKTQYYIRRKNNWIRDETISENTFIDNNTLFCNMKKSCDKNLETSVCEPSVFSARRLKMRSSNNVQNNVEITDELKQRFDKSMDEMTQIIGEEIDHDLRVNRRWMAILNVQLYDANNLAYDLGKMAISTADTQTISPYSALLNQILGQDDFVKKQYDIVKFGENVCREAREDLAENTSWGYCKETNTKLMPFFLFDLADAYTKGEDYNSVLDKLCRHQGVLSDDGDAIVDKHSGYVMRKIDFVAEEGYDEAGFKMVTNDVIQKDIAIVVEELLKKKDRVFENDITQHIYNILTALCENLGIPPDGIEDFVLRTTSEIAETDIMKQPKYEQFSEKMMKTKGKQPIPYEQYKNQSIIIIIASALLIGIQTKTPPYKPKITAPGCIRSFSGFPMDGGEEDNTGLHYIACVVNKTKSSVVPWNSIQKMPLTAIQKAIRDITTKSFIPRAEIDELYVLKREFLLLHPEEIIPDELRLEKWRHFLPPVVPYTVVKKLMPISGDFKDEFMEILRKGKDSQRGHLDVFKSKLFQQGLAIIESINTVVGKKEMILKSASNIPFLQNACCAENILKNRNILQYFLDEDPLLINYIKNAAKMAMIIDNTTELTRSSMFYHPLNTSIITPDMPTGHFDENIYASFIYYCNFDQDTPIPNDLKSLCPEKPASWRKNWSLEEKIEYLKKNGKRYNIDSLFHLLRIVSNRHLLPKSITNDIRSPVAPILDILTHFEQSAESPIEQPLIDLLRICLEKYNSDTMIMEVSEETYNLNNYLGKSNQQMFNIISEFLETHGNLPQRKLQQMNEFIAKMSKWNIDVETTDYFEEGFYSAIQFIKTSVYSLTKVYPEIIINAHTPSTHIPNYWGLSNFHIVSLVSKLREYYTGLNTFKGNSVLTELLRISNKSRELNMFIENLPIFTPIYKGGNTFHALFDKRTIYMLLCHCWYSVLYEYIISTDDTDLLQFDISENKRERRAAIKARESGDDTMHSMRRGIDESTEAEANDMDEIQILMGNKEDIKKQAAALLISFLNIEQTTKNAVDMNYSQIGEAMNRSRTREKKRITDFFKDMDSEERKAKNVEKQYKLGRWGVGLQKGLVNYDAKTYDREMAEMLADPEHINTDEVELVARTIDEINTDDTDDVNDEYEEEEFGIGGLGEDYMDGDYYGEDDRDDF
jgi:hypothetical protein